MSMPGFTADWVFNEQRRQYRQAALVPTPRDTIVPQWNPGPCFDWECLTYCSEMNPYDSAICYEFCQIPCYPDSPPEILPPG
jgi:hypothetical protein